MYARLRTHGINFNSTIFSYEDVHKQISNKGPNSPIYFQFNAVTPADLQFMYEMSTKCQWSEVRVNSLRIVSTIGSILARNMEPHPMLKVWYRLTSYYTMYLFHSWSTAYTHLIDQKFSNCRQKLISILVHKSGIIQIYLYKVI